MNPWEVNWSQPNQTPSPDVKPWEMDWSNKTDNYLPNTAALKKGFAGDPLAVFNGPERIRLENILSTYDNPEEEGKKHIIAQYLAPRVKLPPETVLNNFQYSVDAFFGKKNTKVNDAYNQIGELLNPKLAPVDQLRKLVDPKSYQNKKIPDASALDGLVDSATSPDGLIRNAPRALARGGVTLAGGLLAAPDVYAEAITDAVNSPYNSFQTWIAQKPERQLWYRESIMASDNNPLKAYKNLGEYLNNDVAKSIDVKINEKELLDLIYGGEYGEAAKKIMLSVSENIPQYALLFMTNKAALVAKFGKDLDISTRAKLIGDIGLMAIGASSTGSKAIQLKDVPGDPGLKQYNTLMTGLFDVTTEKMFALPVLEKYFANAGVKQKVLKAAKEWGNDFLYGGVGESVAQVSNNWTDQVSGLGNQPLSAGVLEAFAVGGVMEGSPGAFNMLRVIRAAQGAPPISFSDIEQLNTAIREHARQRKEELLQQDDLSDTEVQELRRATNDEQNPSPANTIVDAMLAEPDQQPEQKPEQQSAETAATEQRTPSDGAEEDKAAAKARREYFDERARRENTAPVHMDQIQTAVGEVAAAFPGVNVVVVNAFDELPEQTRNNIAADPAMSTTAGRARGVYVSTDDTVYLIANNLNVADVPTVMFHEALGHKGFYDYLGNQLMPLADKIFGDITAAVQQYNNDNKLGFDLELPAGQRQATLEYVASIAESIVQRGASRPAWWKGVLFQIKQTLRAIPGLKNIRFTDREIEGILAKSYQKMLENKQESEQQDGGISFSVKSLEETNNDFNAELELQIQGKHKPDHVYRLGMPSQILLDSGLPNLPIELTASRLYLKSIQENHPFDIAALKDLPVKLQDPIAVFEYDKDPNVLNVIIEIQYSGKNFLVGINFNPKHTQLIINSIRGLFPKDNHEWLYWIEQDKAYHLDKEKVQKIIDQCRINFDNVENVNLDSVSNIVQNFQNVKRNFKNNANNSLTREDKAYLDAVDRGDMETAQRMVDDAARKAGYVNTAEYRMQHKAPNREDINLAKAMDSDIVPDDYWTHPRYYQNEHDEFNSFYAIKDAIRRQKELDAANSPEKATLTVYRAVRKEIKDGNLRNGDWVTPSHEYAKGEGRLNPGGSRIIKAEVPLSDLWWDANSINELGFDDGKGYVYKNTKNNRKLSDPVTRDENGDIIPPSKRFNSRNPSVSFSLAPAKYNTKQTEPAVKIEYRREKWLTFNNTTIRGPADMAFAFQGLRDSAIERAFITGLKDGKPVCVQPIGFGTSNMSVVFMTNAIDMLKKYGCDAAYLVHNHPSGNITPSAEDLKISSKAYRVLTALDIEYKGHIIIDTTKFTHIDRSNIPAEFEHASRDGKGVKVPVLEQYAVWKNGEKTGNFPVIHKPADIFEVFKGWELDMFGTLVMFANVKNQVLHAELMPVETITAKLLMEKGAAINCPTIFIAAQSMSGSEKVRVNAFNETLKDVNFQLMDVVLAESNSNSFHSMLENGELSRVKDTPGKYSFSLKDIPNTDIERLGTILVPGIMRGELKTWEDAQAYFESQGIDGLEKHEIQLAFGEARYQMERKKVAKKKKDYAAWFMANHPILWDIEAKIGAGMKIKPDAKYGKRKDVTGYYIDFKNGMPSDEAAKYLGIHEDELIAEINGVKATDLKQQFTAWKHEKNDEDAYWEKLAYEERQRETATIIDDVVTGKLKLTPDLRKSNPEAAQGIYELITGTSKMPPNNFDWNGAMDALVRRSQGVENWQLPPAKAAAVGTIDPNAPAGAINEADASKIYDQGFAAGEQEGKANAENDYLKLLEALRANQKDIVAMQKLLKEFAYQTLPKGERDLALNAIIQLANASNEPTKKHPNGERRELLEKIMNKFQKIRDASRKEQLLERITERIEQTAAKRGQHGKPVPKYSQEEQDTLDRIREIVKMTPGVVEIEKDDYTNQAEAAENDGGDNTFALENLALLEQFGNLQYKSTVELEKALTEIQRLAATGRMQILQIIREKRAQVEANQQRFIPEVTGPDGLVSPQQQKILEDTRKKQPVREESNQFYRHHLRLNLLLNNITRFAGKPLSDTLGGIWAHNQHLAEQKEMTGLRTRGTSFNKAFNKIFGTTSIRTRAKKLEKMVDMVKKTGVFRNQRLDGKGIEYTRLTVEEAQAMINDHIAGINHLQDYEIECLKHQLDDIAAGVKEQVKDETTDAVMQQIYAENKKKAVVLPRITDPGPLTEEPLSQNGALQLWLCWQQDNVKYKMMFNGWNNSSIAQLEAFLEPGMKEIGEYMRAELEKDYQNVNETFRQMYYISMPHTKNYFPTKYGVTKGVSNNTADQFGMPFGMATVSPGALKSRRFHLMEPSDVDAFATYAAHLVQMEHFKAIAPGIREMRSVINNPDVKNAIIQARGEKALKDLIKEIEIIADGGDRTVGVVPLLTGMYSPVVVSKLMFNIQSAMKQLGGAWSYQNSIPIKDFILGSAHFWTDPIAHAQMLIDTDFFKNRWGGAMDRDLRMLLDWSSSVARTKSGWMQQLVQEGAILNKAGDALSIVVFGYSVYKYHHDKLIKRGMSEPEAHAAAIIEWEKATDETQQSGAVKDMNRFQLGNAVFRMFTTYLSNPMAVMTTQSEQFWDMWAGRDKDDYKKLARMIYTNHIVVPTMMVGIVQAIHNGTDWDEYDLSEFLIAMIIGPFEAIFMAGKVVNSGINALFGNFRPAQSAFPAFDDLYKLGKQVHRIASGDAEISAEEIINGMANIGAGLTPFNNAAAVAGAGARESRRWFKFFSEDKPKHKKKDTGIL